MPAKEANQVAQPRRISGPVPARDHGKK